ncbi:flavodoxin domain-containing protein [Citricoccus muralis]|uniref:Flavodoxin domain-containing protein n=1 Tax=Citricoccus muralis TaxID=169134 RepID=A0ABY8H4K1_9MICC|nr:flavodoxin domain-containing protein [Citricoccus muralis]WFP16069.1 flavodoxin domain-containing protein [Citricoccus muralis]
MTTLVVASTRHGSTREIAERICTTLREAKGVNAIVEDVSAASKILDSVDAVIVVAPVYRNAWHKPATAFVTAHQAELDKKSLFLAASGGSPELDAGIRAKLDTLGARDVTYLRGAVFEEKLGFLEKLQIKVAGGQYGDFRNWHAVEEWAKHVGTRGAV